MKKVLLITILVLFLSALTVYAFEPEIIKKPILSLKELIGPTKYKVELVPIELPPNEFSDIDHRAKFVESMRKHNAGEFQINWSEISPLEFLEQLKQEKAPEMIEGEEFSFRDYNLGIWNYPPEDWIKEEHIYELIKLIASKETSKSIYVPLSSCIGGQTTVGHEAMFLIEGYKQKVYPPEMSSSCYFEPDNVEEYRQWYQEEFLKEIK